MPAQLVALTDGPSILLDRPILLIGRHPECDIQIESRKISRRHCCVAQVNDYLVVRDLDSTNGIRINGVRQVEGRLAAGDELTIGNHRYRVSWEDSPCVRPATPRVLAAPAVAAPLLADDDDEALESSDEPVALPEPPRGGPARPGAPLPPLAGGAFPGRAGPPAQRDGAQRSAGDEESFILPENLELLPGSGSFPRAQAPPPG